MDAEPTRDLAEHHAAHADGYLYYRTSTGRVFRISPDGSNPKAFGTGAHDMFTHDSRFIYYAWRPRPPT